MFTTVRRRVACQCESEIVTMSSSFYLAARTVLTASTGNNALRARPPRCVYRSKNGGVKLPTLIAFASAANNGTDQNLAAAADLSFSSVRPSLPSQSYHTSAAMPQYFCLSWRSATTPGCWRRTTSICSGNNQSDAVLPFCHRILSNADGTKQKTAHIWSFQQYLECPNGS